MNKRNAGFTLLEILVVLVIIGIATSMAVLTIGHNQNKQLEAFANELVQTITLAEEQALLQPTTIGLVFTPNSFQFYEHRPRVNALSTQQTWELLSDHELSTHRIPRDIQLTLKIADQIIPLSKEGTPKVLISTNGNITPFIILIGKKNHTPRYQIIGDTDGTVISQAYKA